MSPEWNRWYTFHPRFWRINNIMFSQFNLFVHCFVFFCLVFFFRILPWWITIFHQHLGEYSWTLGPFPSILGKQIKQIVMYGIGTSIYFEPSLPRISITFGVRLLASLLSLWLYGYHPICSHVKLRLHWLRCAPLLNGVVLKEDFANFPRLGGSSQLVSS